MAQLSVPDDRTTYRPSGRVFLPFFLPLLATAFLAAAIGAALILLSARIGLRLVIVTPLVLTLPAAGMLYIACGYGKCRNRVLAFLVGAMVGAVVSPGRYQAEIVEMAGWQAIHRVDVLPNWIELRMKLKTIGKAGAMNAGGPQPADTVDQIFNWIIFTLEVGMIVVGCGLFAASMSSVPFDETHKKWMKSKTAILPSGSSDGLAAALAGRDREKLAEQLDLVGQQTAPHCNVTIHFSPESLAGGEEALAFLSASEVGMANSEGHRANKTIFEKWKLDPDEVLRIAPILKS